MAVDSWAELKLEQRKQNRELAKRTEENISLQFLELLLREVAKSE